MNQIRKKAKTKYMQEKKLYHHYRKTSNSGEVVDYCSKGVAEYNLGNYKEAIIYFKKADSSRRNHFVMFRLGQCYKRLNNMVKAQKCFEKALAELKDKGLVSDQIVNNAMSQSNIDTMAVEQVEEETTAEIVTMSDAKVIKLASLAVLIKNFPTEKLKNVLQKFNKPERDVLLKYLKMPDLEEKLDSNVTMRCLDEIRNALPEVVVISYDKALKKMCKIVKNSSKDKILNIIKKERPAIREFVVCCYLKKRKKIPAHIADIVSKYLEENVS